MTAVEKIIAEIDNEVRTIQRIPGTETRGRMIGLAFAKRVALELKELEKEKYKYFFECGRNYQLTGEGTFKELYNETFKQQEQ